MAGPSRYPVPTRVNRVVEMVRRSRFITTLARAPDARAAHTFIQRIREEFPDATHNCRAFVAGPPGSTIHVGMNDDGEPRGTAGRPMLAALLHGGVGEVVAVTTRYFGGVKLGTGGLSRAYGGGVKLALESLPIEEKVELVPVEVAVRYADVDALQRLIEQIEAVVEGEDFGAEVRYRLKVSEKRVDELRAAVSELTRGGGRVT